MWGKGKGHMRKDSKNVESGVQDDERWRRYSEMRDIVDGVEEAAEYRDNISGAA
jgi:hypothetical protein